MMGQGQGQLGPRPTTPQGFPQGVGSPGRAVMGQQGNIQPGFMGIPQHGQVPKVEWEVCFQIFNVEVILYCY